MESSSKIYNLERFPLSPLMEKVSIRGRKQPRNSNKTCIEFKNGMPVFIEKEEGGWIQAYVTDVQERHLVVKDDNTGHVHTTLTNNASLWNPSQKHLEFHELSQLSPLSPPAVLQCLEKRYHGELYYTGAGSTLVALNPFCECSALYTTEVIHAYQTRDKEEYEQLAPHVYKTARRAYSNLRYQMGKCNQSVVVSGESGAGKTVSAKHLMNYLVTVAKGHEADTKNTHKTVGSRVEKRILDSNPILEAFGNAATLKNQNSSRFGKYIELQFEQSGEIEGATLQTYLLEKTRVICPAENEFNFHIFYQLLSNQTDTFKMFLTDSSGELMKCKLADMSGRNLDEDSSLWHTTKEAMDDIGLNESFQAELFKILFAILHLGNMEFEADEDDSEMINIKSDENNCSQHHCEMAGWLLGVDSTKLENVFTHRRITASHRRRQSVFYKPCAQEEVTVRRDCLAKLLYARVFEWVVEFINRCILAPEPYRKIGAHNIYKCVSVGAGTIGILDIYGFESFQQNSLEQLCINYANEKLQQHFVTYFLRDLQADYEREAIYWNFTDFEDNRPCLDLLENNPGVFAILDEECHLNRPSNDEALRDRFHASLSESRYLTRAKKNLHQPSFVVCHYAEPVQYTVESLVEKNKDNVPGELVELLQGSDSQFISSLFGDVEQEQPGKKKKSVLSKFKASLDSLMQALQQTEPHYIRCIKPNPESRSGVFNQTFVLAQLQACGVIETVEISKQAYPARLVYEEFLQRYGLILRANENTTLNNQSIVSQTSDDENKENEMFFEPLDILYKKQLNITPKRNTTPRKKLRRRAGLSSCDHTRRLSGTIMKLVFGEQAVSAKQFGKTKLFLKDGQLERLEAERSHLLSQHAFTIQCAWRQHKKRKLREQLEAIITLQSAFRGWLSRKEMKKRQQAAQIIQNTFRVYTADKRAKDTSMAGLFGARSTTVGGKDCSVTLNTDQLDSEIEDEFLTPAVSRTVGLTLPGSYGNESIEPISKLGLDFVTPVTSHTKIRFQSTPIAKDNTSDIEDTHSNEMYLVSKEKGKNGTIYNIYKSPDKKIAGSTSARDVYKNVSSAVMAAYLTRNRFQLAGAFAGIPYFEAQNGILSRRRMPRVQIKFHTRANPILKYGHFIHQRELMCSLTDCLPSFD